MIPTIQHGGWQDQQGGPVTYEVVWFDAPDRYLNMNDRMHWAQRSRLVKAWKDAAYWAVVQTMSPGPTARRRAPATVTVNLPFRSKRRRDPHNYAPTMKAIIDGLVLAGVWPDDNPDWVATTEPVCAVDQARFVTDPTGAVWQRVGIRMVYDRGPRPPAN